MDPTSSSNSLDHPLPLDEQVTVYNSLDHPLPSDEQVYNSLDHPLPSDEQVYDVIGEPLPAGNDLLQVILQQLPNLGAEHLEKLKRQIISIQESRDVVVTQTSGKDLHTGQHVLWNNRGQICVYVVSKVAKKYFYMQPEIALKYNDGYRRDMKFLMNETKYNLLPQEDVAKHVEKTARNLFFLDEVVLYRMGTEINAHVCVGFIFHYEDDRVLKICNLHQEWPNHKYTLKEKGRINDECIIRMEFSILRAMSRVESLAPGRLFKSQHSPEVHLIKSVCLKRGVVEVQTPGVAPIPIKDMDIKPQAELKAQLDMGSPASKKRKTEEDLGVV